MDFRQSKPIYKQIADYIPLQIIDGRRSDGQRLQSVKEFALNTKINPRAVARTYTLLSDQGIIQTTRGAGYFLKDDAHDSTKAYLKSQFEKEEILYLQKIVNTLQLDFSKYIST